MRMRTALLILFFGSCWGAVEAILGEALHRAAVPRAAVPLSIFAFFVLSVARVYCRMPGSAMLIACCAMLFKFTNAPFFGCHLLGIFLLGAAYDLVLFVGRLDLLNGRHRVAKSALFGALASYLGFALFAVLITYVVRYAYWVQDGPARVLDHIFISGTMAAAGSALAVPLGVWMGAFLQERRFAPSAFRARLATGGISILTMVLWIVAATVSF